MVSINSSAFYSIITGRNCFCCLCFKTVADSVVHIEDEMILTQKDKRKIHVLVGDLLLEVLGAELCQQLSAFDAICNSCMSSAIECFKFIRKCKSNIQNLCKVVDNLTMGAKDTIKGITEEHRAVYVAIDTKRCVWSKYYSKISFQSKPKAYAKFITMKDEQEFKELKKRASVNKRLLKINLIRLEDEIRIKHIKHQQNISKNVSRNNITCESKKSYGPKPKKLNTNNDKKKEKYLKMPKYVSGNKMNAKVNHINNLKQDPNLLRNTNEVDNRKPFEMPQYVHVSEELDKINGICRLKTVPHMKKAMQIAQEISNHLNASAKDNTISLPSVTTHKPLQNCTPQSSINFKNGSQVNSALESPFKISDVELKHEYEEYDEEITHCQFCGVMCETPVELSNHLKTHDSLMIIESIIKVENQDDPNS